MNDELKRFVAERDKALAALDMEWAKARMPGASDLVLLAGMHKARYECVSITDVLRFESRAWLEAHGFKRLGGLSWPPVGELPS